MADTWVCTGYSFHSFCAWYFLFNETVKIFYIKIRLSVLFLFFTKSAYPVTCYSDKLFTFIIWYDYLCLNCNYQDMIKAKDKS